MTRLREVRRKKGLRLDDVVWLVKVHTGVDISASALSRAERNITHPPIAKRAAIARALKVAPDYLWGP